MVNKNVYINNKFANVRNISNWTACRHVIIVIGSCMHLKKQVWQGDRMERKNGDIKHTAIPCEVTTCVCLSKSFVLFYLRKMSVETLEGEGAPRVTPSRGVTPEQKSKICCDWIYKNTGKTITPGRTTT